MSSGLSIRPARPDEAARLGQIGFAAWAEGEHGALDAGRADRTRLLADYVAFCAQLIETIRVAERDGEPVGWGARENGDGYISDLWVSPASQGQGIGTQLLAALEAEITALGYAVASLETRSGAIRAIRFYERNGYRIVWRKLKPTPSLGYAIDKVGMEKSLG